VVFAAAGRADDDADLPILFDPRHHHAELLGQAIAQRHVKHASDLLHAEAVVQRAFD